LLFLFVPGSGTARQREIPAAPSQTPETAAPASISAEEALLLANKLAATGNTEDAARLYEQLRQSANMALRHEAAFQLAGIFMLEGRFRDAALLYQDILNQAPDLPRVRLELARAYFMNKDYEDAQLQFELVKGGGLPPEVLDKVDHFLALIRRRKDWTFNFNLALVPDTNLNQASGGSEECVSFGGMLLCRPLEEKQSGVGLSLGGTFNHYWRFGRDFGLRSTVGLNILEHERSDFDDYQLYLASGPRYTFDSGEASLQPTFRKRWYAGKQYNEEFGLRLDMQKVWDRFVLNGGLSHAQARYDDDYTDSFLRGDNRSVYFQTRYILNDRTVVQAGLTFQREKTKAVAYGSDNWRYALGAYRVFPYGFSLFAELSLTDTRYHDEQWYVTRDYRIDATTRQDQLWQLYTHLSSNLFEKYGITPTLQYVYVRRDSNIWSREYDRHRLNLSFNYNF
jgi:hypothetical protein